MKKVKQNKKQELGIFKQSNQICSPKLTKPDSSLINAS
jgi:hypothetical protein